MDGRELFHQMLNARKDPERAYRLLALLAGEPVVDNIQDVKEEVDIIRNEIVVTNQARRYEGIKQAV